VLLSYSNNAIQTIRTAATDPGSPQVANSFIRPKWGIYRSLLDGGKLRDDSLRIADVLIAEGTTSQVSLNQTITFNALPTKTVDAADFSAGALASSGLPILFTSSNTAVATIVSGNIHIVAAGTTTITASQSGNTTYNAAANVAQTLTVDKLNQTITFNALPSKVVGDTDFSSGASANSGLTVALASSNEAVATIISGNIHIVGIGTTTITASQAGNSNYNAAPTVPQTLTVSGLAHTITFVLPSKYTNSADFDPAAVSSIGSPIIYSSSNPLVARIVDNKIRIVAQGTSNITASAVGNGTYNAATNVQQLIVQCSCVQN
jgi:hypothetical protein